MRASSTAAFVAFAALTLGLAMAAPGPALAHMRGAGHVLKTVSAPDDGADASIPDSPSSTVTLLADWSAATGDNNGRPYIIVDKPDADVFVFDADGALLGSAPALLGSAVGDDATPGVGDVELSDIPLNERTTEAGRFIAHLGPAKGMPSVLWVDFDTSLSMHPVVTSNAKEHRLERLGSPSVEDRRITHGCINVPARFYKDVVQKAFGAEAGVVYIMPDTKSLDQVFPSFGLQAARAPRTGRQPNPYDPDMVAKTLGEIPAP